MNPQEPISALPPAGGIDPTQSYWPIVNSGVTERINRNTALSLTSAPVGLTDTQTLTNKTLTAPAISNPVLSGTITGTYTLGGTPTFPASLVTLTGTQTLTNKTLTAPVINNGSITGTTITTNAIAGQADADSGTVYGVGITNGVIASAALANAVNTAAIQNSAVTSAKMNIIPTTDANSWRVVSFGTYIVYYKRVTFSQAFTSGVAAAITLSSNNLPTGMGTLSTNYMDFSAHITANGGDILVASQTQTSSTTLVFVGKTTASSTYGGNIDITIITAP